VDAPLTAVPSIGFAPPAGSSNSMTISAV
jgi:hypothetical protein